MFIDLEDFLYLYQFGKNVDLSLHGQDKESLTLKLQEYLLCPSFSCQHVGPLKESLH